MKKNQSELKNIITEMKNIPEGINSKIGDTNKTNKNNTRNQKQNTKHVIWKIK